MRVLDRNGKVDKDSPWVSRLHSQISGGRRAVRSSAHTNWRELRGPSCGVLGSHSHHIQARALGWESRTPTLPSHKSPEGMQLGVFMSQSLHTTPSIYYP
eukprot:1569113-Amphidinium_carterae.1